MEEGREVFTFHLMRFCDEGPFSLFLFFTFFSHGGGKGLSVACGVRLGMTVM